MAGTASHSARAAELTIGLLYDARSAYDVKVLGGVAAYLGERGHLAVALKGGAGARRRGVDTAAVDGIIANLNDPAIARVAKTARVPVVGFGGAGSALSARIPLFLTHNAQIGDLAADHLRQAGLAHFAFCGYVDGHATAWSRQRERAFVAHLRARGFAPAVLRLPYQPDDADTGTWPALRAWLDGLPRPVGIMAANDVLGRHLLQTCRTLHLKVPHEVAVIGVDNDDLQCHLSCPPLSSIDQGATRVGYAAAMQLERIVRGEPTRAVLHLVNPLAVFPRQSSAAGAVRDPDVARALAFIEDRIQKGLHVADVVRAAGVPRWQLEQRFRTVLRSTIAASIRSAQLRRVRRLVADSEMPLKQVAGLGGFRSVQHMTTAFARAFGQTPARYRRGLLPSTAGTSGRQPGRRQKSVKNSSSM